MIIQTNDIRNPPVYTIGVTDIELKMLRGVLNSFVGLKEMYKHPKGATTVFADGMFELLTRANGDVLTTEELQQWSDASDEGE